MSNKRAPTSDIIALRKTPTKVGELIKGSAVIGERKNSQKLRGVAGPLNGFHSAAIREAFKIPRHLTRRREHREVDKSTGEYDEAGHPLPGVDASGSRQIKDRPGPGGCSITSADGSPRLPHCSNHRKAIGKAPEAVLNPKVLIAPGSLEH
jgi:hypothetical protein